MTLNQIRSALYLGARILGDVNAVQRGPQAVVARVARKLILSRTGAIVNAAVRTLFGH